MRDDRPEPRDEIVCRARIDPSCYHGRTIQEVGLEEAMDTWREDGTYDQADAGPGGLVESIVCDACYVELMPYSASRQLLRAEIPDAIRAWHEMHPTIPGVE